MSAQSKADFYVAPTGSDKAPGTLARPFASLQRARDAVRERKQAHPDKNYVVMLRGGYYRLSEAVVFGLQDSAAKGRTITYAAHPGEKPILGSGIPVTGWEKWKGKIWWAPAPKGIERFTTLFQKGRALPRSRSKSFLPTSDNNLQFRFPKGRIPTDAAEHGLELRIVPTNPWVMNRLPITKVNPEKSVATVSCRSTYPLAKVKFGHFPQGTAWIENAVEEIDAPGEWAFDIKAKRIYLWSDGDQPPSGVIVPKLTELVRVEGKIDYDGPTDTPVQGLVFRGLTFAHADHWQWQTDKIGWGLQHDWEMFDRPTAMLRFRGAEDCVVEQCVFTCSGAAAIRCDLHAQKIRIERNHIHHVGGVGVLLAGYGPGTKDVNRHNTIINNHIHHIGQVLWHAAGVFAWQSGSNRIAHNSVHDVAYCGIVISGRITWSRNGQGECSKTIRWKEVDKVFGGVKPRPSWHEREQFLHGRKNIVEYNDIHHCMRILGDGNGIYISGAGDANLIRYNYIHDVDSPSMNAAIRCDDDQHGTVMHGNIIANCSGEGFIIKGANTITNNIIYNLRTKAKDGTPCVHQRGYLVFPYRDCTGGVVERNIFFATEAKILVLTERTKQGRRPQQAPCMLRQCRTDKNVYFNTANPNWGKNHFAAQRKYGIEKNSISADPLFVNPAKGDFRLKNNSPALRLGFVPIDYKLIGPR